MPRLTAAARGRTDGVLHLLLEPLRERGGRGRAAEAEQGLA